METQIKYLLTWDEAFQSGAQVAGGKGWNLGRLARYGFKMPRGLVLTTRAYREFIKHNKLQELAENISQTVTAGNIEESGYHNLLTQFKDRIIKGVIPQHIVEELTGMLESHDLAEKPVAVRSSASAEDSPQASFAGIHASLLNVRGLQSILAAVKECYASLWSVQAVVYRRKVNIPDHEVSAAVVLMEMVEAEASGIGFTCDPLTGRLDVLVIHANFGLGESVVSGAVEPDTYYLDAAVWNAKPKLMEKKNGRKEGVTLLNKDGGTRLERTLEFSSRQALPDERIERLGLLLLRVLAAVGESEQHQDVEWVYDGRDFVLVQARPVTALPRRTFDALKDQPDIWSNGNYRDAVPMVQSPLNRPMKGIIDTIHESSCLRIGYRLPEGLQFSRFFNGRLYCNLSALQWIFFDTMGAKPGDMKAFWGGHQPEIKIKAQKPFRGLAGLKRVLYLYRNVVVTKKAAKNALRTHNRIINAVENLTGQGLGGLKDEDFIQLYNDLCRVVRELSGEFWFLSGAASGPVVYLLRRLTKYFGARAPVIVNALMVGGEAAITSAEHGYRLVELAEIARRDKDAIHFFAGMDFDPLAWKEQLPESSQFKQAFRAFIKEFGHRAVYELDIINPRWQEDPSYLLGIVKSTMDTADSGKWKAGQKEKFERAWLEIKEKVPSGKHSSIRKLIREGQAGAAVREQTKSVLAMVMAAYRMIANELGSRFCERSITEEQADIYYCTWPELFSVLNGDWDGAGLRALVAERKAKMREMESLAAPDIIFGETSSYTEPAVLASGNCLMGVPVAAGKASGTARLIEHPAQGNRLQPGDILVAPSTDPGWTPLFLKAGAVVMETGGYLSHGAIVAREYGVPAVVNISGVMRVIKDGSKVVVDGDEGKVYL